MRGGLVVRLIAHDHAERRIVLRREARDRPWPELLARWCAFNPHVPVLLVSAFTNARLRARMAAVPGGVVMDQDFSLEDVRATALSLVGENSLTS